MPRGLRLNKQQLRPYNFELLTLVKMIKRLQVNSLEAVLDIEYYFVATFAASLKNAIAV